MHGTTSSPGCQSLRADTTEPTIRQGTLPGFAIVAEVLHHLGITHLYAISGTPIHELLAACIRAGIRVVGVRHQAAAVMMATAQNYTAGRLAAATAVSAGPGVTNTVTGMLVAKDNCWPVIVLGGRRTLRAEGMGAFQDLDGASLLDTVTKWAACIHSPSEIASHLVRAYALAIEGRPGPVYLDLPEDALSGNATNVRIPRLPECKPTSPNPDDSDRAVEALLTAQRPAAILGKGLRWRNAYQTARSLIEGLGMPFIATPMGRGLIPDDHPLYFNQSRSLVLAEADVILLAGTRLDWKFRFGAELARDAKLLHIDINAEAIGTTWTPHVGIVSDAGCALQELADRIPAATSSYPVASRQAWFDRLSARRRANQDTMQRDTRQHALPMSSQRVLGEIRDWLPADAICALDGNICMLAAQDILPAFSPVSRFTAGQNGCMGSGIPFAIGAKLSQPDRPVLVVCGDFAFGLAVMELETAARYRLPITVVVINNHGPTGALNQRKFYSEDDEPVAMFLPNLRYDEIARALGCYAEAIDQLEQLQPALTRAQTSNRPACLNVSVDPYAPFLQRSG